MKTWKFHWFEGILLFFIGLVQSTRLYEFNAHRPEPALVSLVANSITQQHSMSIVQTTRTHLVETARTHPGRVSVVDLRTQPVRTELASQPLPESDADEETAAVPRLLLMNKRKAKTKKDGQPRKERSDKGKKRIKS